MADEATAVAESSSAPEVATVELPKSGTPEYAEWRVNGTIPEKPQADSAPAETPVDPGEATPPTVQENRRRKPDAEARIKQLTEENKRLKAERTAQPVEPKQATVRTKPTIDDKNPDGSPKYKTYEDFTEDLADFKAEQRIAKADQDREAAKAAETFKAQVEEAKGRHDNFDEVMNEVMPVLANAGLPIEVLGRLNKSAVLPDLIYTIGGDPKELAKFTAMAKSDPGEAREYIAVMERFIEEELSKGTKSDTPPKGPDGKFVKTEPVAPAKRGPESTPEPPIELGARSAGTMDEATRALSDIERGNPTATRAWLAAENAKELRRRRGA